MALEVLEGLDQLQAINVLHLDLRPANILLDKHQHACLGDFPFGLQTQQSCAMFNPPGSSHYRSVVFLMPPRSCFLLPIFHNSSSPECMS